jgi:hypothetical protein
MDRELTYSIYYTPNSDIAPETAINYICFDSKVHVRFRDFNSEMLIIGFEKKLSYLLTYLMNYSYLPKVIGMYDKNTLIDTFLRSSDVATIYTCISNNTCGKTFKGIRLKPNYKKTECEPFGNVDIKCFPTKLVNGVVQVGDLHTFLSTLKISLDEYLFNDSYVVIIREDKQIDINKKFINRENKKQRKLASDFDITQLW